MKKRRINPTVLRLCNQSLSSKDKNEMGDFYSNPENLAKIEKGLKGSAQTSRLLRQSRAITPDVLRMMMKA
jgi:hypothetical protein